MIDRDFYIVNSNDKGFEIRLIVITEKEYKDIDTKISNIRNQSDINRFIDRYKISPIDIVLYGDTNISNLDLETKNIILDEFKKIIPSVKTIRNPINNKIENSYKCFCCDGINISDLTEHKTVYSSFCCLITKLKKPEYILIYKIKV